MKSLDILGCKHPILINPSLEWGHINHKRKHIQINDELEHPTTHNEVLLHEVIHGLDYISDIGLEEDQVKALAGGLINFFNLNREFVEAILEGRCYARSESQGSD